MFAFLLMVSALSQAEVVVIVHPSNNSVSIDKSYIKNIFMGKVKVFPNGEKAIPIELDMSDSRNDFLRNYLGKSEGELQSYWSRMLFTGKAQPPKVVDNEQEVRKLVANNPNLIGFIDSANVDESVRVVKVP